MYITQVNMKEYYTRVSGLESIGARLERGNKSNLVLAGQYQGRNWLQKSGKPGNDMIAWEYRNQVLLAQVGLGPLVDEDEGVFGYPESFLIEMVDSAATIYDYLQAAALGIVPPDVMAALGKATGQLLSTFWAEWTHGDLHMRNIVVGYERGQGWRPWIIDTDAGYRNTHKDRRRFAETFGLIREELLTPEEEMRLVLDVAIPSTWEKIHNEDPHLGAADEDHPAFAAFQTALEREL